MDLQGPEARLKHVEPSRGAMAAPGLMPLSAVMLAVSLVVSHADFLLPAVYSCGQPQ